MDDGGHVNPDAGVMDIWCHGVGTLFSHLYRGDGGAVGGYRLLPLFVVSKEGLALALQEGRIGVIAY